MHLWCRNILSILDSNCWLSPVILDHPQVQLLQMALGSLLLFPQTLWGNYYQQANIVPEGIIRGGRGWLCGAIVPQILSRPPSCRLLIGIVNVSLSCKLIVLFWETFWAQPLVIFLSIDQYSPIIKLGWKGPLYENRKRSFNWLNNIILEFMATYSSRMFVMGNNIQLSAVSIWICVFNAAAAGWAD